MSRLITLNCDIEDKLRKSYEKFINDCNKEFEEKISKVRLADGKFTFNKSFSEQFGGTDEKARVILTPLAYLKTQILLTNFDKEVAWHGVAHRREDVIEGFEGICDKATENDYIISDIFVYPQSVTSTYVDMDEAEYAKWIMENYDNPRMKDKRMQAHSHVNLGVTASSTDIDSQKKYLEQLPDDDFYIFMIWNKKLENNIKIYDLKKNILFEDKDITLEISDKDCSLFDFLTESKKMVKDMVKTKVKPITSVSKPKSSKPAKIYEEFDDEYDYLNYEDEMLEHYYGHYY